MYDYLLVKFIYFWICLFQLADSANMLGKSGAIQILANVIHNDCLDTEDKIKVTITLGHAMENSGLFLLYMLLFLHM